MTGLTVGFLAVFGFALQKAFSKVRPIFRERGKINADVTGRLDRIAGRRARRQGLSRRSARSRGVRRRRAAHAGQRAEVADGHLAHEPLRHRADGRRRRDRDVCRRAPDHVAARSRSADFVTFTAFLAFLVAPVFQIVQIGTQITEALAGLERTHEVLNETSRRPGPAPHGQRSAPSKA